MKTSHGVVQGYDGVAVVDNKHQIIVHAEAFGAPQEHALLQPMVEGTRENLAAIGTPDVFEKTKLTADSGFHSEANMQLLMEAGYRCLRGGYPVQETGPPLCRTETATRSASRKEYAASHGTTTAFTTRYFTMSEDKSHCICPAGKRLHRNGANVMVKGKRAIKFRGNKTDCRVCALREEMPPISRPYGDTTGLLLPGTCPITSPRASPRR